MTNPALEATPVPAVPALPAAAPVAAPELFDGTPPPAVTPTTAETPAETVEGPPVTEPEPVAVDPPIEPAAPTPTAAADTDWPHQWLDFGGDRLAIHKPTQGTLQAYIMATSKYSTDDRRVNFTNLFILQHLSEASYDHIVGRLLSPIDSLYSAEYDDDSGPFGVLMRAIAGYTDSDDATE